MENARRLAAALVPDSAKRARDILRMRRRAAGLQAPTAAYLQRHGGEVRQGPLAGLRYPRDAMESGTDYLVAKLTGVYECELHGVLAEWVRTAPAHIVDVGCAEGYYAVGLAKAMPGTTVHAFDVDPRARSRCAAMAELNEVADRVQVGERCTPATLADLPADGVALLCDAEGYERELLDPEAAPVLVGWPILVELHDFLDTTITGAIVGRFSPTHEVQLIEGATRRGDEAPELTVFPPHVRRLLLDEYRPARMRWAYLRPAARSSAASVSDA